MTTPHIPLVNGNFITTNDVAPGIKPNEQIDAMIDFTLERRASLSGANFTARHSVNLGLLYVEIYGITDVYHDIRVDGVIKKTSVFGGNIHTINSPAKPTQVSVRTRSIVRTGPWVSKVPESV